MHACVYVHSYRDGQIDIASVRACVPKLRKYVHPFVNVHKYNIDMNVNMDVIYLNNKFLSLFMRRLFLGGWSENYFSLETHLKA